MNLGTVNTNRTFLVRFGGISGSFGLAMGILARLRLTKIRTMARPNSPDMPPKLTKKVRLGINVKLFVNNMAFHETTYIQNTRYLLRSNVIQSNYKYNETMAKLIFDDGPVLEFSKFSAPTIAFLAFWLAKKLRLWANSRSFMSYGK